MIRIITDSASDFELSEAEKLNVTVLPMQIQFGNTCCDSHIYKQFTRVRMREQAGYRM